MSSLPPSSVPADAVWLITGVSSGIGLSMLHELLRSSYRVVALSRTPSKVLLPESSNDENTLLLPVDICSEASIESAFAAALAKFGRIDVVVNNAGYTVRGELESLDEQAARDMFEVNFWAPFRVSRRALAVFRDANAQTGAQGGTLVQISSIGGVLGSPGNSIYHASKWALEGLTESLAKEVCAGWRLRFVVFEPGSVKTEFSGASGRAAAQHPAYAGQDLPYDRLRDLRASIEDKIGAAADTVARVMVAVVRDDERRWRDGNGAWGPLLKIGLGADAWALADAHLTADLEARRRFRAVSESTSTGDVKPTLRAMGFACD